MFSRASPTSRRLLLPRTSNLHTTAPHHNRRIPVPITAPTSSALKKIPSCPPPTTPLCACDPPGLDIDRTTPLSGTMPRYHQHLLISTGRTDWTSRIEFDPSAPGAGQIKALQSQRGRGLRDPFAPTLITNSSLDGNGVYILPRGLYFSAMPTDGAELERFVRAYLLPPSSSFSSLSSPPPPPPTRGVEETIVLICSHISRDSRCGLYFPGLKAQFEAVLHKRGVLLTAEDERAGRFAGRVRVAGTSHLSGHKFAGNVVVYRQGWGVWYGRVGVGEVEGIVEESVLGEGVVGEICRGVVGREVDET